jgi:hypothetical protein
MSDTQANTAIDSLPELLAHALAMETEAAERYEELADQMETHRKAGVAAIFRRLEKGGKGAPGRAERNVQPLRTAALRTLGLQMDHR